MYSLYGFDEQIKTIYCLTSKYGENVKSLSGLKDQYYRFLAENNKALVPFLAAQRYIKHDDIGHDIITEFSDGHDDIVFERTTQMRPTSLDTIERIEACIDNLGDLSPKLADLFKLVVHSIITLPIPQVSSGTSSTLIGLMWLNLDAHFNEIDVIELLIHELTHTLLILDELRYIHYHYNQINLPSTYVQSAIMSKKRRLDKVFHSIVVAQELLFAREHLYGHDHRFNAHPSSKVLKARIQASVNDIESTLIVDDCLTARGVCLFEQYKMA